MKLISLILISHILLVGYTSCAISRLSPGVMSMRDYLIKNSRSEADPASGRSFNDVGPLESPDADEIRRLAAAMTLTRVADKRAGEIRLASSGRLLRDFPSLRTIVITYLVL